MKLTKVAFAIASVLAVAAGSANAGQIDSSSTTLAREVIYADNQVVRAPSKSYSFVGVIDARTNEQRLQLQWTLSGGLKWSRAGDLAFTGTGAATDTFPVAVTGGATVLKLNGKDLANADIGFNGAVVGALTGATVDAFLADGDTTLVFNITIPANAANYIKDAVFQINANDFTPANDANVGITNALTVAGTTICAVDQRSADISFKHFTNHNGNNQVITGTSPDSEHIRAGSNNSGRYVNFTENVIFTFTSATQSQTDAATLRTTFLRNATQTADLAPAVATIGGGITANRLHRIGTIDLAKIAAGLDLDYTSQYGNGANATPFEAADFSIASPANLNTGIIEAGRILITVKAPAGATGVSAGSTVVLLTSADAAIAGEVVTAFDANGVATISLPTAAAMAALASGATGARLYYVVNGTNEIPQNSTFNVTALLDKTDTGTLREQDTTCKADLAGIGGGIKIDVRNYATAATYKGTGTSTSVRIINNSESQTADVYAQLIYADGTYGPWGQLPSLAPRAVSMLSNEQIEALLTNAPATANPFGTGTVYTSTAGAAVTGNKKAGVSDRLRIVSNTGTTLRVQSYMIVGNTVIDTSNAQGVDFENNGSRVPENAVDAQPVSQDAINGLSRSN